MKVLMIGDVVAGVGCEFVAKHLYAVKSKYGVDVVVANGENSADGNGITPQSAQTLLDAGVDVLTTGNHVLRRREVYDLLDDPAWPIVRPANYPDAVPGRGFLIHDMGNRSLAVVNLMGTVYLDSLDCPFRTMDRLLERIETNCILVDFHAEATGEKRAMGFYLDGRVSAVVGTHTHVQTADETVLERGTGYISDVGMTGPVQSVLGVKPEIIIKRYLTKMPVRHEIAHGRCSLNGIVITIDEKTGKTTEIVRINFA